MIITPSDTYFIHGLPNWSKDFSVDLIYPEISVSLQRDGYTFPLRPLGFILHIQKGGIIAAFAKDISSKIERGRKVLSTFSRATRKYSEDELDQLIADTPQGKHNELWVDSGKAEIVAAYTIGGSKSFEKAVRKQGLDVRKMPTTIQHD